MLISLSCPEVTIKGGNRRRFEDILVSNISHSLRGLGSFSIHRRPGRVLVESDSADEAACLEALQRIFGIETISFCEKAPPDAAAIEGAVMARSGGLLGRSIRVETKRSDKSFPLTSQELNRRIGSSLVAAGCSVDLENPERTVFIDIMREEALISFGKSKGPGGLPVGSSGKVLSLLSGGIDSPVSSWMMMKRGCTVDLLHVHNSTRGEALGSKMADIAGKLGKYSPRGIRLFLAPYEEFYKGSMGVRGRDEPVVFRRFLVRLSNALAGRTGCRGIVLGDSIGQVASQTLTNIAAADEASGMPVFRPLVAFNKQEIVDLARRIGTYGDSIKPYKDCCSILASRPSTGVSPRAMKAIEDEMGMDGIVARTLERTDSVRY